MSSPATIRTIGKALLPVAAAALAILVITPQTARVSAQDGGASSATGELVVVPGEVQVGETTLAVGFHVAPRDVEVVIEYSEHFTPEGEPCDTAGTAGATEAAVAPTWITLNACVPGQGSVRMVEAASGSVIEDVGVAVFELGTREPRATTISITGLTSSDLVPGQSGDRFSVNVTNLNSNVDYELRTIVLNNLSLAFDRGCTDFSVETDIIATPSYTENYTVYGCVAPGNRIVSWIREVGGIPIVSTGISNNYANVADPTVTFTRPSFDVDEGSDVRVTVELSHRSSHIIRVPFFFGGTADDEDYDVADLSSDRSLYFRNRSTSESFRVLTIDDAEDEDDETVNLVIRTPLPNVADTGRYASAVVNIEDNDENRDPFITTRTDIPLEFDECGRDRVAVYSAYDPDGHPISWRLQSSRAYPDRRAFDVEDDDLSDDGFLVFDDPPDFENPLDFDDDNEYRTMIEARDDHGGSDLRNITVIVKNLKPTITSTSRYESFSEGGTGQIARFTASDPCGGDITWALTGRDAGNLRISPNDGTLRFASRPDFENPTDEDADNEYEIIVEASDGNLAVTRDFTVEVTNLRPAINAPMGPLVYAENATHPAAAFQASDPGGGDIFWSLTEPDFETDKDAFTINDGALRFRTSPDYENPLDRNRDNVYRITVRASDGVLAADRDVTITVTDVDEGPEIAGPSFVSFAEGTTGRVANYDASVPGGGTVDWSLPNTPFETDHLDFRISPSGELRFVSVPDYENPHDRNRDNEYRITVRASVGDLSDDLDVTITVTDVNEAPVADRSIPDRTLAPGVASREIDLAHYFSDPDGDALIYSATSANIGVASASVRGGTLTIQRVSAGAARITVTAADRPAGHPERLTASQNFAVTLVALPTITVAPRQGAESVGEGQLVPFTLSADPAPSAELTVNVRVTETGSFIDGTPPSTVTITSGRTTASFNVATEDDTVDEDNGSVTATVRPGAGYTVGSGEFVLRKCDRPRR